MDATAVQQQIKVIIIMGPQMIRGHHVLEAIEALYYLPETYRLVFAGHPQDQVFYNEIVDLVDRFSLGKRVRFMYEVESPDVFIADDAADASDEKTIYGDSPEAIASAVLRAVRT